MIPGNMAGTFVPLAGSFARVVEIEHTSLSLESPGVRRSAEPARHRNLLGPSWRIVELPYESENNDPAPAGPCEGADNSALQVVCAVTGTRGAMSPEGPITVNFSATALFTGGSILASPDGTVVFNGTWHKPDSAVDMAYIKLGIVDLSNVWHDIAVGSAGPGGGGYPAGDYSFVGSTSGVTLFGGRVKAVIGTLLNGDTELIDTGVDVFTEAYAGTECASGWFTTDDPWLGMQTRYDGGAEIRATGLETGCVYDYSLVFSYPDGDVTQTGTIVADSTTFLIGTAEDFPFWPAGIPGESFGYVSGTISRQVSGGGGGGGPPGLP